MRDQLLQRALEVPVDRRQNLAREYLQVFLLRLAHEAGAFRDLALVGGTALRLLHHLPRYSEDLDFSSHGPGGEPVARPEPADLFQDLKDRLVASGYQVGVKARKERAVASAFFRFAGMPADLGWSQDRRLALSIKLEIDRRPPAGARVETTLVQRFFPIALRHYDLPSLFAGKLHALLTRAYPKGRDWYDLVWYLTEQRGLSPNLELLNHALAQTRRPILRPGEWPAAVRRLLRRLDWDRILSDLRPFVELPADLAQLSPELIGKLLAACA